MTVLRLTSLLFAALASFAEAEDTVQVVLSTLDGAQKMALQPPIAFGGQGHADAPSIEIDLAKRGQDILGLGASLEHATCENLSKLPPEKREEVIEKIVSPDCGIGMNLMRLCIGASAFIGEPYYTYDDLPDGETDPELAKFSIEKDRAYVLPVVKIGMKKNPNLLFFASPWSRQRG